ncbi:hypothetical protein R5W23_002520 [Gemmata sp. JC673]|uniref:Twin-arginine translocation signal domain-containing protein n=1 Tax=Gemmata algarum TaxID=2975278 RepID=A0ABU5F1N3_9BACT|nr:hypothetical protein [Gemmata algarum]MDY3561245.1 hypothetical protein [Gemmata algarum]
MGITRRQLLAAGGACAVGGALWAGTKRAPRVLRSSWQAANIGDIAHTPKAREFVRRRQKETMKVLADELAKLAP